MSSPHTLKLDDDWDLHVDPAGNLPVVYDAYSIAQNVANAFRLFTEDAWYFPERGIAHFLVELRKEPRLNVLKSRLRQAALNVEGVKDCEISLLNIEGRDLSGMTTLTLESGEIYNVEL
jgi:hypothetical protein